MELQKTKYRGFFNKYQKNMPLFETITKDLSYLVISIKNYFRNNLNNKSILVYPHYPSRGSTIYKIGKVLGYNITNKPKKSTKLAIYWEYLTFREEFQFLEEYATSKKVVNLHSRNISKQYVDKVHKDVFGYSTIINPLEYNGKIVKKNDINAKHDGEIIQGPITHLEDGFIYQILIDNTFTPELVMDIRVPVVNKTLDFVYLKYRNISERFKNTTVKTDVEPINKILKDEEIELLNQFCQMLHLEYGELDVLRNKDDGKIYVVDVNNTPQGPPANTSKENSKIVLEKIGKALLDHYSKANTSK